MYKLTCEFSSNFIHCYLLLNEHVKLLITHKLYLSWNVFTGVTPRRQSRTTAVSK